MNFKKEETTLLKRLETLTRGRVLISQRVQAIMNATEPTEWGC